MEFKIDTKPTYVQLTPITNHADANMAAALRQKWDELAKSGSGNVIIDLHNCLDADTTSFNELAELHGHVYENEQSIVFTGINETIMKAMKEEGLEYVINITPTEIEAIDIISMEILERDLFKEDE